MRDALSILDKIVSFTNGEVSYLNTLEHLNILDDDYYFRLLDHLLGQDISGAMLLYDEINNKGFEGDQVMNGFAEFLRNLLVSKDAKAAALLDVVEGMHEKYISVAAGVNMSYLVSALNILNETEINYKMARNKRLHVELALIKLNFLQQAIELANDNGTVIRKKRVDMPVLHQAKLIAPPQQKSKTKDSKLFIEEPAKNGVFRKNEANEDKAVTPVQNLAPANETPGMTGPEPCRSAAPQTMPVSKSKLSNGNKRSLLDSLRDKYGDKYVIEEIKEPEALSVSKLNELWLEYTAKLEEQQKHSSANTFKLAKLDIESDNFFTITVQAITQQKFIEQEKTMLCDFIQQALSNRSINFKVVVEEGLTEQLPVHLTLNSRQRFERIAEKYPLVKELKNRLNLDLDY